MKEHQIGTSVLLAEDDPAMQRLLAEILAGAGHRVVCADDGASAMARLGEQTFDALVTDLKMPRVDGIQLLRHARARHPSMPVVVLTAFGTIAGAVEAMRLGASDFLTKPLPDPSALRETVARALSAESTVPAPELLAVDPAMKQVVAQAELVAARDTTVLLLGASGTGKEVIATLIHRRSPRRGGPFIAVNCAAIAESLLESELFGHEKGAYTGATEQREGRFFQADGGTLFLDEIGETSPGMQAKLLRALQERRFERVGGNQTLSVDTRVVAATNRDLEQRVCDGQFREDLYYRLAVFPISIPRLSERPADIVPLAEHFLALLSRDPSRTTPVLTEHAKRALLAHDWPGNVRQLANVIERAHVLAGGDSITPELLGLTINDLLPADGEPGPTAGTLKDMERRTIADALRAEGGNRRRTAKRLGIALRTLQYKIKAYGLQEEG